MDVQGNRGQLNLCFAEADRSELLTLLSHRTIDIVIAAGEPSPDISESLLLVREPIYLAVSGENPLAGRDQLSWDDVAGANSSSARASRGRKSMTTSCAG